MTTVHEAWSAVMADVQSVGKTDKNAQQNFRFRGIDAVMNAVGPAMRTHGVFCVPMVVSRETRDVTVGKRGTPMREVTLEVRFTVYGPDGDCFAGIVPAEALDAGDKATAKAMSVAYRTFLLQALTIPTDEPDPDSQTYERAARDVTVNPATPSEHAHRDRVRLILDTVAGWDKDDPRRGVLSQRKKIKEWPDSPRDYDKATSAEVLALVLELDRDAEPFGEVSSNPAGEQTTIPVDAGVDGSRDG